MFELRSRLLALVAAAALASLACRPVPAPVPEPPRGYVERSCGFDLDDDGISGEKEDCRICDGRTRDPDGDGIAEDLIYVDCQRGLDSETCGDPSAPCRTIAHAWASRADGADDGAEDIVCFTGICTPEGLSPASGGAPGIKTLARSGRQARSFELPRHPAMLVGWDLDRDRSYPPADRDDVSILDGGGKGLPGTGLSRPFVFTGAASRFEMAHFTVKDYGRFSDIEESGFLRFTERGGTRADHFFFHDLKLVGINRDQPAQSHRIVFNFFTGGTSFHHIAFFNLEVLDAGGFMTRGAGPYLPMPDERGGDDGPYRFERLSVTAHGCDDDDEACRKGGGSAFIGWKLWGYLRGVEILDSVFDANLAAWQPKRGGNGGAVLVSATQCSRDWTVAGNAVYDFKVGFRARGGFTTYCGYDDREPPRQIPRTTNGVLFAENFFLNRYVGWHHGDWIVHLDGGQDARRALADVTVRDNLLVSTDGFDACVRLDVGHSGEPDAGEAPLHHPGRIVVRDNICIAGERGDGRSVGFDIGRRYAPAYEQQRITLERNRLLGLGRRDLNLRAHYRPAELEMQDNLFSPDAGFVIERVPIAAAVGELDAALGLATGSRLCRPQLAEPPYDDTTLQLRPVPEDACLAASEPGPVANVAEGAAR